MNSLKRKTFITTTATEGDKLYNEFGQTHNVKASQTYHSPTEGWVQHVYYRED